MSCIAIIPARGGSKRLPRKNILDLHGQPMISWIIRQALESGVFSDVVVSSDDDDILMVAEKYGAVSYERSSSIAQDRSTVAEVCLDVLTSYNVDRFCCLYATAALLKGSTIRKSSNFFNSDSECSMLMGVSEFNYHPYQAMTYDENGYAKLLNPEYEGLQSQFYPPVFVSNGTFYWANAREFINEKTFYGERTKPFLVDESEVCDLDTEDDYQRLKIKFLNNV